MAKKTEERLSDEHKESVVAQFLDLYLYPKLKSISTQRIIEKELQVRGVDLAMPCGNIIKYVDEKAGTDNKYLDGSLYRFCVELSTLNINGNLMEGWFANTNLLTTHYLFVWIRDVKDGKLTCVDDIKKVEACLVPKSKIYEYLFKKGWNRERLMEKAHNIRYNEDRKFFEDGLKFYFAEHKKEKPIGVTIPINVYKRLADFHYTVTPDFIY